MPALERGGGYAFSGLESSSRLFKGYSCRYFVMMLEVEKDLSKISIYFEL